MFLAATLLVLMSVAAGADAGLASYRVKIVLYPGDDGAAVARRLAAMYRGTLETAIDAQGEFVIALPDSGASLMRRDPAVKHFDASASESTPHVDAVAGAWKLGDYEYDGSGNIRKIGADFFVYDTKNRLVVSADASGSTVTHKQTYAYDTFGNLTNVTTAGAPQTALTVSSSTNRVTAVTTGAQVISPQYDGAGNMTGYGTATYTHDALNVMTKSSIGGVSRYYVYSASDERIGTVEVSSAGTRAEWTIRDAGGQVLRRFSKETTGEWKWQEDYVYRGRQMLAAEVPDPARTRHFHLDHLGTPRLITGNGGAEISRHNYRPFGVEIAPMSSPTREKKQFTGHERDAESLDYMHARFYAPYMGRFLAVDPGKDWNPTQPQSWNMYAYASNNPLGYVDPDGRKAVVRRDGDKIIIALPIRFTGDGATPQRIAAYKTAVQAMWSGKFGKYDVTTTVTPGRFLLDNSVKLDARPEGGNNRSEVFGSRSATIFTSSNPIVQSGVDAHETGHLMRLDDKYKENPPGITPQTSPLPGWQGNLMAEIPGSVDVRNIEEILDRNRVRDVTPEEKEQ